MHGRRYFMTHLVGLVLAVGLSLLAAGQLASRPTEEWIKTLERPERVANIKIDQIISHLDLKPGQAVLDVGAGPGVLSLPLAKAVAPGGKVYAVEIDQGFLDRINQKTKEQNVTNVQTVLGKFADPNLPARDVDVTLFHDVLHHIEKRAEYLKALAQYMKPKGRIAVIELDAKTGAHKDRPELQVTKEELNGWMADAGFKLVQEVNGLYTDGKWFVIYARK